MLKTIPMETVSTGHTNSCKVQSGVPSGLDFCYVTCCLHSPPKSWLLCQALPFSSSHMTFTPLQGPLRSIQFLLLCHRTPLISQPGTISPLCQWLPSVRTETHNTGALLNLLLYHSSIFSLLFTTHRKTLPLKPRVTSHTETTYWKES